MKLSRNFLSDYLDVKKVNFDQLAKKMVLLGHEYDQHQKLCDVEGLVIGEVVNCIKHPDSKKLSICRVNLGDSIHQIVCGAANVRKDQKVVVAPVGAKLTNDFVIKKIKLAGYDSEGMICSLAELGLEKTFLKEADYEEIIVLDKNAKIGEDPIKYLELDDEIIDFDLTANRGDLLSIMGMAYEIGALYNLEVKYPDLNFKETDLKITNQYQLKVETENCLLYLAKLVNQVKITESPNFIKNRLIASGIRPINNVVDISNYVMLETGQPIHFFDADKVKKIGVRMGRGEEIQTLDSQIRNVTNQDIIITNNDKPIALAGVMGGLDSEVTNKTKNIIVESAIFSASHIRNTSKKALRSEASIRFEKGLPKERTYLAVKRACFLLAKYADGKIASEMLVHDKLIEEEIKIKLSLLKVNKVLGIELKKEEILDVLDRLQLPYRVDKEILVLIPSRRLDLRIEEDLIEEIGRMIGFDKVKGKLPNVAIKQGSRSLKMQYLYQVKNQLCKMGLSEVITYSLTSEMENKLFNKNYQPIKILSPSSKEREYLRKSLIPSLLNVYNYNHARKVEKINIFEVGSIYYQEDKKYVENNRLGILVSGILIENKWQKKKIESDFYLLKGIVEQLLSYLGFNNRYQIVAKKHNNLHPGRSASIEVDDIEIGLIGQIHPKITTDVYVCELDLDKIFEFEIKMIKYKEPNRYPSIRKDVAFVVDKEIESYLIEKIIKKVGSRILDKIEVFDVYQINEKEKSIAYSLIFRDKARTLNDEEVMIVFNKIITEVQTKLKAKLRSI